MTANLFNAYIDGDEDRMPAMPISRASILIVDGDKSVPHSLKQILKGAKYLHCTANATRALKHFRQHAFDLVFLNIILPDMSGIDLLKKLKQIEPHLPVVMAGAVDDIQAAVDAMKAGAFDFLSKPLRHDHVRVVTERALARRKECFQLKCDQVYEDMVGRESFLQSVEKVINALSPCESNALIQGASSTCTKLIARSLHDRSTRKANPYVTVNCAGTPARLLERDLIGLASGDASRAVIEKAGKIASARNGSLFLENINYLSLDMQAILIHIIQEKAFVHPRSHQTVKADIRIIAATSQNLKALVDARLFREDLYASLNEMPIDLSLIGEKGEDLGLLLEHFMKRIALRRKMPRRHFSNRARTSLRACDWPGNVREFEYLLGRLCNVRKELRDNTADPLRCEAHHHSSAFNGIELKKAIRAFERQHILAVLKAVEGNRSQAARQLGIHRNTLRMKTKALGIDFL